MSKTATQTTLITGNTYPHREALKRLGGKWDAAAKGWLVGGDRADEARALVAGTPRCGAAPRPTAKQPAPRKPAYRPGEDEVAIQRRSSGRGDRGYEPGQIVALRGEYYIVTGGCRKYYDDDTGGSLADGWYCAAYARRATEAEGALRRGADAARQAKTDAAAALRRAIDAMPGQGRGATLPQWVREGRSIEMPRDPGLPSVDQGTLYLAEAGAAFCRPVYDDDPIIRVAAAGTPEHAAVIAALAAVEG